jgi:hypothetical protein
MRAAVHFFSCLQKIIDYLKMDVEGAEFCSLEAMFQTDILQTRVKQLGFEIHVGQPPRQTVNNLHYFWTVLKHLEEIGFKRWYIHFNHHCAYQYNGRIRSACYEMVYINTRFMNQTTPTTN